MKRHTHYIRAVLLMLLPLMTVSCRKELCYNHFRAVSFNLSWEHEWERDYGMNHSGNWDSALHGFGYDEMRPGRPEWVNLIMFAEHGPQYETYFTSEGGDVIVDEGGGQSFLLYNGDTEYIVLSDMVSAPNARASATGRSRASLSVVKEIHHDARTTNPPDVIYSAYLDNVPAIGLHESRPLAVKMQPLVYTYIIRYEFEYGIQHVALARGALGGMAESVYLRDGTTSDNSSIILYDCDIKNYGCEAHVRSFGVPGFPDKYFGQLQSKDDKQNYTLNLELRLHNGTYVEFNYDITDQIEHQPRGGIIRVSGIRIEDSQNMSDAGFDVNVEDWGDRVDIDLPVGPSN
ncbi:MAG: DUF5119 domain-containing protein [Muribaculaceae bacterium]|nr:DUF5119 domain-containing protein [Muribaculaceae bacterium]